MKESKETLFSQLIEICAHLRSQDGCIWDKQQDHSSLIPFLMEETLEVKEAIEKNDHKNLCEELGDLLYQIVFHSQIGKETGNFDIYDVLQGIIDKLIRRHPHVFAGKKIHSVEDIIENWKKIKKEEKEKGGK